MNRFRISLLAALALAPTPALADVAAPQPQAAADPVRLVDVEVKDEDHANAVSTHFIVAVSGSGAGSVVKSSFGDAEYVVMLRHDGPSGTYRLDLRRQTIRKGGGAAPRDLEIGAVRTLESDKRQIVAVVDRPDASKTEVALTAR